MRFRTATIAATLALLASPAIAHDPSDHAAHAPAPYPGGPRYAGFDPAARDAWLADCRQRVSARDRGLGGAAIGGVIGGLAGNRIAGRGNRTVGTLAGAAIGAAAGAIIDKAEDAGRNRDECEAWLDDYYARYTQGGYYPQPWGQGYYPAYPANGGYPGNGCCMAQPMMMPQPAPHCTETVEYIYEDVPVRATPVKRRVEKRVIVKRVKSTPDKRIKMK